MTVANIHVTESRPYSDSQEQWAAFWTFFNSKLDHHYDAHNSNTRTRPMVDTSLKVVLIKCLIV
ncbi:hypothetical protein T07_11105 [Trichinella nelsoni]|uniref:Uncharacterized protein n=1 Tax=Trichinella nelsoni TaxID=6336 RepID=A0A0V0S354_9BILA|nr:hypothetical protein T07_11105 [Trichinella nelsoni]